MSFDWQLLIMASMNYSSIGSRLSSFSFSRSLKVNSLFDSSSEIYEFCFSRGMGLILLKIYFLSLLGVLPSSCTEIDDDFVIICTDVLILPWDNCPDYGLSKLLIILLISDFLSKLVCSDNAGVSVILLGDSYIFIVDIGSTGGDCYIFILLPLMYWSSSGPPLVFEFENEGLNYPLCTFICLNSFTIFTFFEFRPFAWLDWDVELCSIS